MQYLKIGNYMIDEPLINIVYKIKSELHNGKLKTIKIKGNDIWVSCPNINHKDGREEHASCCIYIGDDESYGVFHCFSCGCKGTFDEFVSLCFDEKVEFGKEWLIARYGDTMLQDESINLPEITLNDKKYDVINENILNTYQSWHPYLEKRKLTRNVCELFKVKYDDKQKMIVFPVYDENEKLIMFTRRSVLSKLFVIDACKEKPVYLYYFIKKNNIDEAVVCESQINALTCWTYHVPAIALFGTGTRYQMSILNKSCIRHYYLAFDGDDAGDHAIVRFLKSIRPDVFVDIMIIPRGKDVNDLSEEEFNNLQIVDSNTWILNHKNLYNS